MAVCSHGGPAGELLRHEPMARHTTWRCGGPADLFYRPADIESLACFVQERAPEMPIHWVGLGSNLLVRDGGLRGAVVALAGRLDTIELDAQGRMYAEAGASCALVARAAVRAGWVGAEFFSGIPGTMGGALAMNAGAFGGETWSLVEAVQTLDRAGQLRWRTSDEFRTGYRHVEGPADEWFVACRLKLEAGDAETAAARVRDLLERRGATQPTRLPNAGSVFRNPPGDFAARLIESCGLKGVRVGGACVSEKHANFIVNDQGARAADIEALIERVAREVEQQTGVRLEPEVRIIGEREPRDD